MRSAPLSSQNHLGRIRQASYASALARNAVLRRLSGITTGCIEIAEGNETQVFGKRVDGELYARIEVRHPAFYSDLAFGGSVGAGESWMSGSWQCNDLVALVRILLRNRSVLEGMEGGLARLAEPLRKLYHWVNRNTREGARRNIAAHYDLGNEFFSLWLDETMMYSSAIFEQPDMSLHQAQLARLDHICRKLQLRPEDKLVEIGTGWGGFALHAARHYGCRVTTTTISAEQHALASQRVKDAGLSDRITVLRDDFRDLEGRFDKLVSIEMIEAIGSDLYDEFFSVCSSLLKDEGLMLVQAITIADQQYAESQRSVDFIQRYIFPGACLPSGAVLGETAARVTDMRLLDLEDIGLHYAETLRHWRIRFNARLAEVRNLGYSETFIRMWEFYLCYCEGAFLERAISDLHLLYAKPRFAALPVR